MQMTEEKADRITETDLTQLPEVVQRYLRHAGVVGKSPVQTVYVNYTGQFRLGADRPWMPMQAEQVYTTQPPSFQWQARFKMFGLPLVSAKDTYNAGQARMSGKLAGMVTIFDASDDQLRQGSMLRYLQEMIWFPAAYLNDYIHWEGVDAHAADVTFTDAGQSVTGRMYFDDAGRVLNFVAERYRESEGSYTLDTWSTPMTEYGTFEGVRVPVAGRGVWQLDAGDLAYVNLKVNDIAYDPA